jgi:hypothetical protein
LQVLARVLVQLPIGVATILLILGGCGKSASQDSRAAPPVPGTDTGASPVQWGMASRNALFRAQIVSWQKGPQVTKSDETRNEFQVKVLSPNGADPEKFEVLDLFPYMKVHGHGVPKSYAPKWEVQGSVIQVKQLGFVMSGPWEVNIKVRVNGAEDTIEIPVEVP